MKCTSFHVHHNPKLTADSDLLWHWPKDDKNTEVIGLEQQVMTFTCNCIDIYSNIVCTGICISWDELCPVMDMWVLTCAPVDRDSKIWSVREHLGKRKEAFSWRIKKSTPLCLKAQVFKGQPRFSLKITQGSVVVRSALRTSIWHSH